MTDTTLQTRTVVVEREMPFPPERLWRALTQPHLIAEWLMQSDFAPVIGHAFRFTADWGGVDGKVLTIEPNRSLAYRWDAHGLQSVVTWTLTPTPVGTHLKMEQVGFKPDQDQAFHGARFGWNKFFGNLEAMLSEVGNHYGDKLAGWWFDDGATNYYYRSAPWEALAKAAKAGKHVFLDKPIANSVADARALTQACRDAKVVLALGRDYTDVAPMDGVVVGSAQQHTHT